MSHKSSDADPDRPGLWQLWELVHDDGTSELSFFPKWQESSRRGLSADAKLLCEIEARSYDDAMQRRNDFLGWGPYKPIP
jgi:hypothetical protein